MLLFPQKQLTDKMAKKLFVGAGLNDVKAAVRF